MAKVIVEQDDRGVVKITTEGVSSHAHAIMMLATGIHAVHGQHDEHVSNGAAGREAAQIFADIKGSA